jgi:hypothetical protein
VNDSRLWASHACAAIGVVLLIVATVMPWDWYPAVPLFIGLALLCVSHVLTPCQDQITRWWRGRITK